MSKVEAGKLELEISTVSVGRLVQETLAHLEDQVQDKEIELLAVLPEEVRDIETDEAKLTQVLINLVGNALKFTEKGSICVVVHVHPESALPEKIEVIDTGPGIPEGRLSSIFEAFQQAESSTSRKYGGTGLGLAISNSLCELMGYQLKVESELGVGSTFSIILAEDQAAEAPSS